MLAAVHHFILIDFDWKFFWSALLIVRLEIYTLGALLLSNNSRLGGLLGSLEQCGYM